MHNFTQIGHRVWYRSVQAYRIENKYQRNYLQLRSTTVCLQYYLLFILRRRSYSLLCRLFKDSYQWG